tara:strand:+ start:67 stop:516 length:450 start_codon:yes stop_codon:yes gene_type:complete
MKPTRTWIVVADGARFGIYENLGPGKGLRELPEEAAEQADPPSREMGTDQPGRSFDSAGQGRHAMAPRTDPHEQTEKEFVVALGKRLNDGRTGRAYDRLVLIAPPKALGYLRAALDPQTARLVVGEIDKDLTASAAAQIEKHVSRFMAT